MADITYCTNMNCPLKKCERHLSHLKKFKGQKMTVKVANLGGICREYLAYVYDCVVEEEKNVHRA